MGQTTLKRLHPTEIRNIASVVGVGILFVGLIVMVIDLSVFDQYPAWVFFGLISGLFGIIGLSPIALRNLQTAEAKLIVIFLFVTASVGGFVVFIGFDFILSFIIFGAVGLAVGITCSLAIRASDIPNHSVLVCMWLLFLIVVVSLIAMMASILLEMGERAALIVASFLLILAYLVHSTLLEERAIQMHANR